MREFELTTELLEKITYWKVSNTLGYNGTFEKLYKKSYCKNPEDALKKAKKINKEKLYVSGLTVHAETKPILIG